MNLFAFVLNFAHSQVNLISVCIMVTLVPINRESGANSSLHELLTRSRKESLREASYWAIRNHFRKQEEYVTEDRELDSLRAGVFVTLKIEDQLRGCIGFILPPAGLLELVKEATILAATEDPRFLPVSEDEVEKLTLELTVLDRPYPLEVSRKDGDSGISVGEEGIMVESSFGKGVLLPKVATEFRFNRREFVEAVCQKAGLDRECWRDSANRFYSFRGIDF